MRAGRDDISSLAAIRIAYLEEDLGSISASDKDKMLKLLPDYFRDHIDRDLFAFVEKYNGTVVSAALLLIIEKPSSPNFINGKIGNVLSVYTVPEYRHRGFSSKLMNELIETGKKKGLDYIELLATEDGHSLYKKLGFRDHKTGYTPMRLYL